MVFNESLTNLLHSITRSGKLRGCTYGRNTTGFGDCHRRHDSKRLRSRNRENRCVVIKPLLTIIQPEPPDYIRLSTTIATNALLERKGHKHALLITKGFKDLLLIGNQSRPKIFDLNIRRPAPLFSTVLEVDERVTLVGYTSDPKAEEHAVQFDEQGNIIRGYRGKGWDGQGDAEGPGKIVKGLSGEAVRIMKQPGTSAYFLYASLFNPVSQMRLKQSATSRNYTTRVIVRSPSSWCTLTLSRTTNASLGLSPARSDLHTSRNLRSFSL
jgi:hypothetical protein